MVFSSVFLRCPDHHHHFLVSIPAPCSSQPVLSSASRNHRWKDNALISIPIAPYYLQNKVVTWVCPCYSLSSLSYLGSHHFSSQALHSAHRISQHSPLLLYSSLTIAIACCLSGVTKLLQLRAACSSLFLLPTAHVDKYVSVTSPLLELRILQDWIHGWLIAASIYIFHRRVAQ